METIDLLLTARWILPIAPKNCVLEHHALAIHAGRIKALLPLEEAKQQYYAENYLDLKDHVLMPGLVNMHTHAAMNLFRGLADDLQLMDWLNNYIWPAEKAIINAESVEVGTRLAIAEMLRGGITCFNDNYFYHDTVATVAAQEGMRACAGLLIMNVGTAWAKNEKEYLARAKATLENNAHLPGITWALTPGHPFTVSDASLIEIKNLAEKYDTPIHMHVHETRAELEGSMKDYGMHPLARLHQLGLLSKRFIAIHMTQLTEAEIELVSSTKTNVVHCPESNLKLCSGFAPIAKLLKANVNVSIGTDGAASNNDLDLFGEMRTAAFIAKAVSGDPTTLPAHEALAMATINGAKALGLANEIGSLEAGKAADVIAIDLSSYLTQPVYNPVSHLVYALNRLQVSDVWVAGKRLLKSGELIRLDVERTLAQAARWTQQIAPFKYPKSTESIRA
jgi:5-methylthioadenosine/S-adenosylhomocysteine deaminase